MINQHKIIKSNDISDLGEIVATTEEVADLTGKVTTLENDVNTIKTEGAGGSELAALAEKVTNLETGGAIAGKSISYKYIIGSAEEKATGKADCLINNLKPTPTAVPKALTLKQVPYIGDYSSVAFFKGTYFITTGSLTIPGKVILTNSVYATNTKEYVLGNGYVTLDEINGKLFASLLTTTSFSLYLYKEDTDEFVKVFDKTGFTIGQEQMQIFLFSKIVYHLGKYIYLWPIITDKNIITSADGETWTENTFILDAANPERWSILAYDTLGDYLVYSGVFGAMVSKDLVNWQVIDDASYYLSVCEFEGTIYIFAGFADSYKSTNGVDWVKFKREDVTPGYPRKYGSAYIVPLLDFQNGKIEFAFGTTPFNAQLCNITPTFEESLGGDANSHVMISSVVRPLDNKFYFPTMGKGFFLLSNENLVNELGVGDLEFKEKDTALIKDGTHVLSGSFIIPDGTVVRSHSPSAVIDNSMFSIGITGGHSDVDIYCTNIDNIGADFENQISSRIFINGAERYSVGRTQKDSYKTERELHESEEMTPFVIKTKTEYERWTNIGNPLSQNITSSFINRSQDMMYVFSHISGEYAYCGKDCNFTKVTFPHALTGTRNMVGLEIGSSKNINVFFNVDKDIYRSENGGAWAKVGTTTNSIAKLGAIDSVTGGRFLAYCEINDKLLDDNGLEFDFPVDVNTKSGEKYNFVGVGDWWFFYFDCKLWRSHYANTWEEVQVTDENGKNPIMFDVFLKNNLNFYDWEDIDNVLAVPNTSYLIAQTNSGKNVVLRNEEGHVVFIQYYRGNLVGLSYCAELYQISRNSIWYTNPSVMFSDGRILKLDINVDGSWFTSWPLLTGMPITLTGDDYNGGLYHLARGIFMRVCSSGIHKYDWSSEVEFTNEDLERKRLVSNLVDMPAIPETTLYFKGRADNNPTYFFCSENVHYIFNMESSNNIFIYIHGKNNRLTLNKEHTNDVAENPCEYVINETRDGNYQSNTVYTQGNKLLHYNPLNCSYSYLLDENNVKKNELALGLETRAPVVHTHPYLTPEPFIDRPELKEDLYKNWEIINESMTHYIWEFANLGAGVILAGTDNGCLRSVDYGLTWSYIQNSSETTALANCGNGIVLGCLANQIKRSTDYGATWSSLTPNIYSNFRAIEYCGNGVLVAGKSSNSANSCFIRSTDFGKTWAQVSGPSGSTGRSIWAINYIGNNIIVAELNDAIWKSVDKGVNWVNQVSTYGFGVLHSLYLGNGIILQGGRIGDRATIKKSINKGDAWDQAFIAPAGSGFVMVRGMVFDRQHGIVLCSPQTGGGDEELSLLKSDDLGQAWSDVFFAPAGTKFSELVYLSEGKILLGSDKGLYSSII